MLYEQLIPLLESKYGELTNVSMFLNYGTPALVTVINILNSKCNCVVFSTYAKSLDMVHEHLMDTSHQFMTVTDDGNAVENEIESGISSRLPSVIYTNDINFLIRPLNNRVYIAIDISNSACLKNVDRYALIYPKCRDPAQNINSSQSSTISYLNRNNGHIVSQITKFLLDMNGNQGRTLVIVPNRYYLNAINDSFTANGLRYNIIGQEDNYESEQYANLCLCLSEALSAVVIPYDTIIDTGLSSINCIVGFGLQTNKVVPSTHTEIICRTSGSTKNVIIVGKITSKRHCVPSYDRETLNTFGYFKDFNNESYNWAQHDALLINKFKILPEHVNLPLSIISISIFQSWIKIRMQEDDYTESSVVQEAIIISSILDNLHNYVFKTMQTSLKYSPVDYARRLKRYQETYFDKFKGKNPVDTIFNVWNNAMRNTESNLEEWCQKNNIVYSFFLNVFDTIQQVSMQHGALEIEMKLPNNVYQKLEPLIYETYGNLAMRWVSEATYESLYAMNQYNKTSLKRVKLDLDPDVGYYENEDIGLTLPSGHEKPIYVSYMPPYLIPMGIDKDSELIMSYIPLREMPTIDYSEYNMPYPL
jgi:hypothetical protein